jgi:hypothetical protein
VSFCTFSMRRVSARRRGCACGGGKNRSRKLRNSARGVNREAAQPMGGRRSTDGSIRPWRSCADLRVRRLAPPDARILARRENESCGLAAHLSKLTRRLDGLCAVGATVAPVSYLRSLIRQAWNESPSYDFALSSPRRPSRRRGFFEKAPSNLRRSAPLSGRAREAARSVAPHWRRRRQHHSQLQP